MTCIVGIIENGEVFVGGDSASVSGWAIRSSRIPKVFRNGPFVIGYTSSFRMGQILHYQVDLPRADKYDEKYMVTQFIEEIRKKFKDLGYSKILNNEEEGGSFIVGAPGALYEIDSDYQVNYYEDGFATCGCGREFALGAMQSTPNLKPMERIQNALQVASYFSAGVTGPFTVLRVDKML